MLNIKPLFDLLLRQIQMHFGERGFDNITDTNVHTGPYYAILGTGSAVLNSAGTLSADGDDVTNNHAIADGSILYGHFTSVQLASGTCYAYRK